MMIPQKKPHTCINRKLVGLPSSKISNTPSFLWQDGLGSDACEFYDLNILLFDAFTLWVIGK